MIRQLSEADMKGMLLSVAWRNVTDKWRKEMPKLSIVSCSIIYMPRKFLINPSKLIPRRSNEPLQHCQ